MDSLQKEIDKLDVFGRVMVRRAYKHYRSNKKLTAAFKRSRAGRYDTQQKMIRRAIHTALLSGRPFMMTLQAEMNAQVNATVKGIRFDQMGASS
jgi:hypothetical protein